MKGSQFVVRGSRLGMAILMLLSLQVKPVWAAGSSGSDDAGILPIETSNVNKSLIDELFGPDTNRNDDNRNNNNNNQNNNNQNNNNNNNNQNRNNNPNQNRTWRSQNDSLQSVSRSNVSSEFKCNLFESVPYNDILSAVNALNSAVTSPACSGDSRVNVQGIVDNNKVIANAVKDLRNYVENPDTIQAENASDISNRVDLAIRAATSVANSFAQTDLLKKECRQAMSIGQIATSINDVINGLTPYALMAATLTTGGAAAVPFIVGGSVITGAVSSMTQIIQDNSVKIEQADVRRAIVENACQFIRLDQKYKFLIKSRQEQISKITSDLDASQRLFSAKIGGLSGGTSGLVGRKNALDAANEELNNVMAAARGQLELDKQFMKGTTDNIKICQLGIQLAVMSKDNSSYVAQMLGTLDKAMIAYGTTNIAQAQALKTSGTLAAKNLERVAGSQFSGKVNYDMCAQNTKSFVETVDQSANLAKQLVKLAQDSIEKGLQANKEYSQYKARLSSLNQKQYQAERVRKSLDKLQAYANTITQSEIDSEMTKLRRGLFANGYISSSPVLKWFDYVNGLHRSEVSRFNGGMTSLRVRAYKMTPSAKLVPAYPTFYQGNQDQLKKDSYDAKNLIVFNLKTLPLGTAEHDNVCRELSDIWNHWTAAIDHLAASDAFCNMLEPYVYDNRSEDAGIVKMCRGYSKNAVQGFANNKEIPSTIASIKDALVKNNTRDWALLIKQRMADLACVDLNEDPDAQ
jgi:hypothetical protein